MERTSLSMIRGINNGSTLYNPDKTTAIGGYSFLSKLRIRTGNGSLDLPPEAQWEYACRAGMMTALNNGCDLTGVDVCGNLNWIARYNANGYNNQNVEQSSVDVGTARVGSYAPNALGLYDMIGNVAELCCDFWVDHLGVSNVVDPPRRGGYARKLTSSSSSYSWYRYDWHMAGRGGTWRCISSLCRSSGRLHYDITGSGEYRSSNDPSGNTWDDLGFRLYSDASF